MKPKAFRLRPPPTAPHSCGGSISISPASAHAGRSGRLRKRHLRRRLRKSSIAASPPLWRTDGHRLARCARYADSHGYQADWERFQWRSRDWVIDAFNRNEPFDQFTIDQVAGDLLPNATIAQKTATGFNRNHRMNTEGGSIPEEWRTEYVIDRVSTVGSVWLGLTLGVPAATITSLIRSPRKSSISLFFFNNVPETGKEQEKAGNHVPFIKAPRQFEIDRIAQFDADIAASQRLVQEKESSSPRPSREVGILRRRHQARRRMDAAQPASMSSAGKAKLIKRPDHSILVSGKNPPTDTYTIKARSSLREITAIRLEALTDASLPAKGPGRAANGNIVLSDVELLVDGKSVRLGTASADLARTAIRSAPPSTATRCKAAGHLLPALASRTTPSLT